MEKENNYPSLRGSAWLFILLNGHKVDSSLRRDITDFNDIINTPRVM